MPLYPLAVAAAALPLLAIHISYFWAASNAHVPWCFVYIDSCTSISATGRNPPEAYLFKALMIPSAVAIATYWFLSCRWLIALGCQANRRRTLLLFLGAVASAGLVLYSVMLGSIGDIYQLQRRIGVTTFFGLTYLAQLLIIWLLGSVPGFVERHRSGLRLLTAVSIIILVTGLVSVGISAWDEELYHRTDDAFEWSFTLMLCIHVFITAMLWRATDFRARFDTRD